jgi:ABC-2 type transport system ATP-binding protein
MRGTILVQIKSAIAVRGVGKGFPRKKDVLHNVDLDVRRGELFGLLGPNGVGKTTLLKMMATLVLPDRGSIEIDGIDAVAKPMLARSRIGFCSSEDRSFYFRLTAGQNLRFFGALCGLRGRRLNDRVRQTLAQVQLLDAIDRRFGEFSSGMRQRLVVARALLSDPPLLLFDEPTRAVDPIAADELHRLMRDELVGRQGKTLVLATNLLQEAWSLCDRVAVVSNATIAAIGPPEQLNRNARSPIEFFKEVTGYAV